MELTRRFWADFRKDRRFFGDCFRAVLAPCAVGAEFSPRRFGSDVLSAHAVVPITEMFFRRDAFKIVGSVIGLIAVFVVDLFAGVKIVQPARSYDTVHKPAAAQRQISLGMSHGSVRNHLSKNFATTRYGVKMIKHAVFNTAHRKAYHAVSPLITNASYNRHKGMSNE